MARSTGLLGCAALALVVQASAAAAAPPAPCVTRAEAAGLVGFVLPTATRSIIDKCAATLGPDAYLTARAPRLVAVLETNKDASWPMAKAAFLKLSGDKDAGAAFAMLSDKALQPIFEEVIAAKLLEEVKTESCRDVDTVMAALEPLPAANLTQVLTEVLMIAGRKDKKLSTCPG